MFDLDLIKGLQPATRALVRKALVVLVESNLVVDQRARNLNALASGAVDESPLDLQQRILDYRRKEAALAELEYLASTILDEEQGDSQ